MSLYMADCHVRSFSHFLFLRHRIICWPGPLPKEVVTEFFFYYRSGQKRLFLTQQGGSGRCASGEKQEGPESSDFDEKSYFSRTTGSYR